MYKEHCSALLNRHLWHRSRPHDILLEVTLLLLLLYLFIYFFAALGLRCCARAFSSCGGLLFATVRRLLIAMASLVAEHGL